MCVTFGPEVKRLLTVTADLLLMPCLDSHVQQMTPRTQLLLNDNADVELDTCVLPCLLSCLDSVVHCCELIVCRLVDNVIDDESSCCFRLCSLRVQ